MEPTHAGFVRPTSPSHSLKLGPDLMGPAE
jgi:hypothetical protein